MSAAPVATLAVDPIETLKRTVAELHKISQIHAEGMKHMTDALVAFDARLRALEKKAALIKRV